MEWAMPAPRQLGKDTGLQTRMALTLFLLGAVYVVLIVALLAAGAGAIFVGVIAVALLLAQCFTSDKLALHAMGAREGTPEQAPEFHAMTGRLCVQAELPNRRVARADADSAQ